MGAYEPSRIIVLALMLSRDGGHSEHGARALGIQHELALDVSPIKFGYE